MSLGNYQELVEEHVDDCSEQQLSVNYEFLINKDVIPTNSLKDIWMKAKRLLFSPGLIVPVPGQPGSQNRMVASDHNEPHHVTSKSSVVVVYVQDLQHTKSDNILLQLLKLQAVSKSFVSGGGNSLFPLTLIH